MKRKKSGNSTSRATNAKTQVVVRRRRSAIWMIAATVSFICLAALVWVLRGIQPDPATQGIAKDFPLPKMTPSVYLNTKPEIQYVGSDRCRDCHSDQHATYLLTAHSRSMSLVDPDHEPADGEYHHEKSGRRYRVYRRDGQLRHRESITGANQQELVVGDYPLKYLVGSGHFSRSYLVEDQGFLVESPLTWYTSLAAWAMSPGYDHATHQSFNRAITHDCLYCHSGPLERDGASDERLRVHETAISCERCHGPGALHVAKWSGAAASESSEVDKTIVNPRHLSRDLSEAICHQCHLNGEVKVPVRGRRLEDFRPGLPWQDFVLDYRFQTESSDMTVVGHTEQLHLSRCYQQNDSMSCLTCHDPHVQPADQKSHYRQRCLTCHDNRSCGLPEHERSNKNGNDCAACHMPQSPTDIPHIAFTHHRVGIHQSTATPAKPAVDHFVALTPVLSNSNLDEIDRSRALGLAYFQYFRDHRGEATANAFLAPAKELLVETANRRLLDPSLAVALGELAGVEGDLAAAERWLQDALKQPALPSTERIAAQRAFVEIAMRQGRLAEAIVHLQELTRNRRDPADWFLLGICQQQTTKLPEAAAAFERVIEMDPTPVEPYQALADLYRAMGNMERETWCRQQIQRLTTTRAPNQK